MTEPAEDLAFASEFPAATREQWLKLVDGVLKGAPFDKRLVARSYDGLTIQPLYPRDSSAQPVAARAPGAAWAVMQRVDHPDPAAANEQALHDLENGATGLTLVCRGSVNANGYGLDCIPSRRWSACSTASISMPASSSTSTSVPRRAMPRRTSPRWCDAAASRRNRSRCVRRSTRSAAWRRPAVRRRGASLRPPSRVWFGSSPGKGFAGRSRSRTGGWSTMPADRRRRSSPSRLPARSPICARWKRAASRSMPRAA